MKKCVGSFKATNSITMTRKLLFILVLLMTFTAVNAQAPVTWTITARSIGDSRYEIHATAHMASGWHIYAHRQPPTAIAVPTSVILTSNPLILVEGPLKEDGRKVRYTDKNAGIEQDQYLEQADFVQVVKVKAPVAIRLSGTVTFQACTDAECLRKAEHAFSIEIPAENNGTR